MATWLDLPLDLRLHLLSQLSLSDAISLSMALPSPPHSAHVRARVARLLPLRNAWVSASHPGFRASANLPLHQTRAARMRLSPAAFSALLALQLGGVRLRHLNGISELRELRVLDASSNCLEELPEELAKCRQLRELNVGRNRLKAFPDVVLKLPQLHTLSLHHNCICNLPEEWGQLHNLQRLGLFNCAIRGSLPDGLCKVLGTQTEQRRRRSANLQRNRLDSNSLSSLFRRFPLMATAVML